MHIRHNVSLKDYSSMRLGGVAQALTSVANKEELTQALAWAKERGLPVLVLGGGSNVIFRKGYDGLVIVNRIPGFEVLTDNDTSTAIRIGAGENWDGAVARTVARNLHGIEYLSAIPGTTGATPVQNVGAYGAEIADVFVELEAYDTQIGKFVTLNKDDCQFSYRNSIFKSAKDRRYIITSVTLRLTKEMPRPPFYASLQRYLDEHNITTYTPQTIRDAVIAVRARTLPDPSIVPNTGSFFKNPIIPSEQAKQLIEKFPDAPHWPLPDGRVKLAAGWLMDKAGLKGHQAHGMKTYAHNALVLVNDSATSYDDLAAFRDEIVEKVHGAFGITFEQEPELL